MEPPRIRNGLWLEIFVAVDEIGYILGSNDVKRLSCQNHEAVVLKLPFIHPPPLPPLLELHPTTPEASAQLAQKVGPGGVYL